MREAQLEPKVRVMTASSRLLRDFQRKGAAGVGGESYGRPGIQWARSLLEIGRGVGGTISQTRNSRLQIEVFPMCKTFSTMHVDGLFHEKLNGTSFEVQHVSDRPSNIFDFPNCFPSEELTLHRTSLGTTDIYCCSIQAISYFSRLGFSILKLIHALHRLRKKPQAPCCCHLP